MYQIEVLPTAVAWDASTLITNTYDPAVLFGAVPTATDVTFDTTTNPPRYIVNMFYVDSGNQSIEIGDDVKVAV